MGPGQVLDEVGAQAIRRCRVAEQASGVVRLVPDDSILRLGAVPDRGGVGKHDPHVVVKLGRIDVFEDCPDHTVAVSRCQDEIAAPRIADLGRTVLDLVSPVSTHTKRGSSVH